MNGYADHPGNRDNTEIIKDEPAVIILNYDSYEDTLKLIKSIEDYDPGLCVIVVDNASDPEERRKLTELEDRCILILLEENGGYAAGNNAGIRKALQLGYDTFLIANSDTRLISKRAVRDCYDYMKSNGVGILGPKMVNESGEDVSGMICADRYGRTVHQLTDQITECRCLTGAFMLIRRSVIERTGYLREFYFLYREDTDYCMRAYHEGVKIVYFPKITVVHKAGTTTKSVADYYYYRNMFVFSREIYGTGSLELALFYFFRFMLYSFGIIKGTASLSEKNGRLKRLWRAYYDGVRDIRGRIFL
ncbi:MAG: glycosyltransferase family 2 protein [Lachnospiraceae bacterium]|nr:glycosyltransferase family 2 protein [Lachnospiraceae bacterium]